jgi:hypothetical protein
MPSLERPIAACRLRRRLAVTMLHDGVARATCRSPPGKRTENHDALRPRTQNLHRHPDYMLAAYMASGT